MFESLYFSVLFYNGILYFIYQLNAVEINCKIKKNKIIIEKQFFFNFSLRESYFFIHHDRL